MVARSHVTHENVENLTRDQIVEQLQEFMTRAKDRMIDVTPEQSPTNDDIELIADCSENVAE
jgi:hypothetical protein